MPVMDGTEFLKQLRQGERTRVPVIAVSAAGGSTRHEALKAGADEFIDKPIRLVDLATAVEKLLKL
jgi:CheY-like chemotaxis protein